VDESAPRGRGRWRGRNGRVDVDVDGDVNGDGCNDRDGDRDGVVADYGSIFELMDRVGACESIHVTLEKPRAPCAIEEHPVERASVRLRVVVVALHHVPFVGTTPPAAARTVRAEEPRGVLAHRSRATLFVDGDRAGAREEPPLKSIAWCCFEHGRTVGG